jgi:hypothetical protein
MGCAGSTQVVNPSANGNSAARGGDAPSDISSTCYRRAAGCLAVSPDGTTIVTTAGTGENALRIWRTATWTCKQAINSPAEAVRTAVYSPDGKNLVCGGDDRQLRVWNTSTSTCTHTVKAQTGFFPCFAYSPDGSVLVSNSDDNGLSVWETATWTRLQKLDGHTDSVAAIAFSSQGNHIASCGSDSSVRVWSAATGHPVNVFRGHTECVRALAFSPDGKHVCSAGDDRVIRTWDLASKSCQSMWKGHTRDITAVVYSPDGKTLVSASRDRTLRVWDVETGTCRQTLRGHTKFGALAYASDGVTVISACDDNSICVLDTVTGGARVLAPTLSRATSTTSSTGGMARRSLNADKVSIASGSSSHPGDPRYAPSAGPVSFPPGHELHHRDSSNSGSSAPPRRGLSASSPGDSPSAMPEAFEPVGPGEHRFQRLAVSPTSGATRTTSIEHVMPQAQAPVALPPRDDDDDSVRSMSVVSMSVAASPALSSGSVNGGAGGPGMSPSASTQRLASQLNMPTYADRSNSDRSNSGLYRFQNGVTMGFNLGATHHDDPLDRATSPVPYVSKKEMPKWKDEDFLGPVDGMPPELSEPEMGPEGKRRVAFTVEAPVVAFAACSSTTELETEV